MVVMVEIHPKETNRRRQFDAAFKRDTIRFVEIGNRTLKQVANELDISEATVNNWVLVD